MAVQRAMAGMPSIAAQMRAMALQQRKNEKLIGKVYPKIEDQLLLSHLVSSCGGYWMLSKYQKLEHRPMTDIRLTNSITNVSLSHGIEPFSSSPEGKFLKANALETVYFIDTINFDAEHEFEREVTLAKWREARKRGQPVPLKYPERRPPHTYIFFYARLTATKAIEFRMLFG